MMEQDTTLQIVDGLWRGYTLSRSSIADAWYAGPTPAEQ